MKSKKKNDLALELVDDVLDVANSQQKEIKSKAVLKKKKKKIEKSSTQTVESDKTVDLSVRNVEEVQIHSQILKSPQEKIAVGQNFSTATPIKKNSPDVYLTQTENLRLAQEKIIDLEYEIERLRGENEGLAAAGETFKNKADTLTSKLEKLNVDFRDKMDLLENERNILSESLSAKDKIVEELKRQEKEYEMRLSSNIQKIRVRERELENRLEILKVENSAILRNKDEMILDLKRQIDHYENELSKYKNKVQELNNFLNDKRSNVQRTIKALKMALSLLDGNTEIYEKDNSQEPETEYDYDEYNDDEGSD